MTYRFDDLWSSAAMDGASCPIGYAAARPARDTADELDLLMDAWFRERSDRIECSLVLEQARGLLAALLSESGISSAAQRKAARVIHAIDKVQERGLDKYHP